MICPLRREYDSGDNAYYSADCAEFDCAWWSPPNQHKDFGECAIKQIASELESFLYETENV